MGAAVHEPAGTLGLGPLLAPVVLLPGTLMLALAYGYAQVYFPLVSVLSVLLVVAYTGAVGHLVTRVRAWGKVRSGGFMLALAPSAGLLALYLAWAAFAAALLGKHADPGEEAPTFLDVLQRPGFVWRLAGLVSEHGRFRFGSVLLSGPVLWGLWLLEAVAIVGGTVSIVRTVIRDQVLCEACGVWCVDDARRPYFAAPVDPAGFEPAIAGDPAGLAALEVLPEPAEDASTFVSLDLKRCPGCERFATAILRVAELTVDRHGRTSSETADLSPRFVVDPVAYERLAALAKRTPGTGAQP